MDSNSQIKAFVDACSICYASGYAEHLKEMEFAFDGYMRKIKEAVAPYGCTELVGFVESWRWKQIFRFQVAVSKPYKSGRKGREKPQYVNEAKRYAVSYHGFREVHFMEAEDATSIAAHEHGMDRSILCSIDKDLRQVPGLHYNYFKDEWESVTIDDASRRLWIQVATGDSVDSIPGIPSTGSKRAEKLLDGVEVEEYPQAIATAYREAGLNYEYFLEQCRLIYILRRRGEVWTPLTREQWEAL